jgi:hypothetical protein
MIRTNTLTGCALMLLASCVAVQAQTPAPAVQPRATAANDARPPVAFRADFDSAPSESPVTMASIKSKELRFATYGPGKNLVDKTWHAEPPNQGGFIWSGNCTQLCGFTLYLPNEYVDLSGAARITWNTEQTGLHQLRLMIKLASGQMLVSDQSVGASSDWQVSDLVIRDLRWRALDTEHMNDASLARGGGQWLQSPDLSRVAEIGWTDLQAGSGHSSMGGSSRVKSIEVYGRRVPRQ